MCAETTSPSTLHAECRVPPPPLPPFALFIFLLPAFFLLLNFILLGSSRNVSSIVANANCLLPHNPLPPCGAAAKFN